MYAPERLERHLRRLRLGGDGERQRVNDHVLARDAVLRRGVVYELGALYAALGGLGYAALVEREADDHAAVFLHQREHRGHALGLGAHGVYHRLAVIAPHGALERAGVRAVELQGQAGHALQGADRALEHLGLVHAGKADVDVQDVRARVLLRRALGEDIVHVRAAERLLELGLARRVYALADNDGGGAYLHRRGEGGNDGAALPHRGREGQVAALADEGGDVLRRGAAAAAEELRAGFGDGPHAPGEVLRAEVEHRLPVHGARQASVRRGGDGEAGRGGQPLGYRQHLRRAEAAVEAQGVHAQALEQRGHGFGRAAGEQPGLFVVGRCGDYWKSAVLLCGEDGGLELVAVAHRLDDDEVGTGLGAVSHDLGEERDGVLEVKVAERLEELARGADVEGDPGAVLTLAGPLGGFCNVYGGSYNFLKRKFAARRVLEPVGAEGVGVYDVRTRVEVRAVQALYALRVQDVPGLRPFAGLEAHFLQASARAAVQEQPPFAQYFPDIHFTAS